MHAPLPLWVTRVAWLVLPFTTGGAFDGAPIGAQCLWWVLWGVTTVGLCVFHPATLTLTRCLIPVMTGAGIWTVVAPPGGGPHTDMVIRGLGLAAVGVAAVGMAAPEVGRSYANGISYGDELRVPLRPPGGLLAGPIQGVWALGAAGLVTGPLLVADRRWVVGVAVWIVGWPLAVWAARVLHTLSTRWLVFVPGGITLIDPLALVDPLPLGRADIILVAPTRVDPATGSAPGPDEGAVDLSRGGLGLVLEIVLDPPVEAVPVRTGRRSADQRPAARILLTPARPGFVITEAERRGYPTLPPSDSPASPVSPDPPDTIPPPATVSPS